MVPTSWMTIEERNRRIIEAIKRSTARHTVSPEAARAHLVAMGISAPDGQLTPEYGGPPRSSGDKR